jgi:hypothetical protein
MNTKALRVLTAIFALSASIATAQTSSPVAYIYVSSNYSGSNNRVVGYAASADGKLTEISGSPWADNLSYLATNGSLLFGSTNIASDNGKNVFSYRVGSNGALKYIGANNIQDTGSENACNVATFLTLDHTGSYLYVYAQNADACDGNAYAAVQSFAVNKSTGLLKYLGEVADGIDDGAPLTMLADNVFAYGENGAEASGISCFKMASNGNLGNAPSCNFSWPDYVLSQQPSGSDGNYQFVAADPTNHLAFDFVYSGGSLGDSIVTKIGTAAVDTANGSLTSNGTYDNMPSTDVNYVESMTMAPSGKLLAVGGQNGVQIFNFNPNGQASANTGLITMAPLSNLNVGYEMYWDTSNHLYVISDADNALHVFTVTPTGTTEAPGSPYTIPHPVAITGHSL